jgi:hypothetical protein
MTRSRFLAATLALTITCLPSASLAQQATGVISGKASNQFKPRFTDYTVQVRNAVTGESVSTKPLSADGKFAFNGLPLNQNYLVEILLTKDNRLICTEGPYALTTNHIPQRTDVTIGCGTSPAILWLLVAAGGTASAVGMATASGSR